MKQFEKDLFDQHDAEQQPPSDIVAYTELRSCSDLTRLHQDGDLKIDPEYQRSLVWNDAEQTRFIDSLIKQLPIPSMCFALDYKSEKWQVIDGLQRMSSIIRFLTRDDWKLSKLKDINQNISGQVVGEIKNSSDKQLARLYTRVKNTTLPITIIRCEVSKKEHEAYLFTIFHRLNAGGQQLNNQEIRNCIYNGDFNRLLKELNDNQVWKQLQVFRGPGGKNQFMRMEVILRFFAFLDDKASYSGALSKFLNDYMSSNRNPSSSWIDDKKHIFIKTMDVICNISALITDEKINSIELHAVMHGIAKNISVVSSKPPDELASRLQVFLSAINDPESNYDVASKAKLTGRLEKAETTFAFL